MTAAQRQEAKTALEKARQGPVSPNVPALLCLWAGRAKAGRRSSICSQNSAEEYGEVNGRARSGGRESLCSGSLFCLYENRASAPCSLEASLPLGLLRGDLRCGGFQLSRLGNVYPEGAARVWHTADSGSEPSLRSGGFSLRNVGREVGEGLSSPLGSSRRSCYSWQG